MSKLDVEIPEFLRRALVEAAAAQDVPLDQLVALAVAEKLSALRTVDYLTQGGTCGQTRRLRPIPGGGAGSRAD